MPVARSRILLFLGAGASADLCPTMTALTRGFERERPQQMARIRAVKKKLGLVGFPRNIETILSYAQGSLNPRSAIRRSDPFVSNFVRGSSLARDRPAKTLVKDIKEFISRECNISEDYKIDLVVRKYRQLFAHLVTQFRLQNLGTERDPFPDLDIFTTNYDNIVEQYCYRLGRELFFGYTETGDGTAAFTPEYFDNFRGIRLYKLHGSVTLGTLENSRTFYSRQGLRIGDKIGGVTISERTMIYGYEKVPPEDPYFEMLYRLKQRISRVDYAIAIGYSFSDQSILTVCKDAIEQGQGEVRLIILNPHASRIKREKFGGSSFVRAVPGNFTDFLRVVP